MQKEIWPFEDRVRIIKGFVPIEQPLFDNADEDTFRFNMWGLYYRVCEAIKSYIVLYEADRIFDALIIAGHALETCAMLSYIKDNPSEDAKREKYNSYFAGMIFNRIFANLETSESLEDDISWIKTCRFSLFFKVFTEFESVFFENRILERFPNSFTDVSLFFQSFKPVRISLGFADVYSST